MDKRKSLTIAGAMSGTSLDAIDWATIRIPADFPDSFIDIISTSSWPMPVELKEKLRSLALGQPASASVFLHTEEALTDAYLESLQVHLAKSGIKPEFVACHGQTIYHDPAAVTADHPYRGTWQLLNGQRLAIESGIPVIWQFRQADMAVGGQGAPLVPSVDRLLFSRFRPCAVLNIGGIANLTFLRRDGSVTGFDSGPGNMVMDYLARKFMDRPYDAGGDIASIGKVHEGPLDMALSHPFFATPPPKSTGRELFSDDWIEDWMDHFPLKTLPADYLATATELTARSIANSVRLFAPEEPTCLFVSGGGSRNPFLMRRLIRLLPNNLYPDPTDSAGVPSEWKEAIAFAILGWMKINAVPANQPEVTGAARPVQLGVVAS